MISQTVEYALRAAVYLAGETSPRPTADIAGVTRVPAAYLAKVLQQLVRAGLLSGQRGPNGGFALARPAKAVTLWDVFEAVEPLPRIRSCPLDLKTHGTNLCPLHRKVDAALAATEAAFKDTTLADLLGNPASPRPLCETNDEPPPKGRITLR